MPAKKKEKKPTNIRGKQTKAGMLLSRFVKEVALEETELIKGEDNNDVMVTKAEALVRLIWKKALGWEETKVDDKGITKKLVHAPDKWAADRLFDRLEGKAAPMGADKKDKKSIADRVTEQGTKRLNRIADKSV